MNTGQPEGCHFWAELAVQALRGSWPHGVPGISSCGCGCPPHQCACTQRRSPCSPAGGGKHGVWGGSRCPSGPPTAPLQEPCLPPQPCTFCRMRFRQTLSSQSMSGSPRPGSFLESRRYTSTSTAADSGSAGCEAQDRGESRPAATPGALLAAGPPHLAGVNTDTDSSLDPQSLAVESRLN